MMEWQMGNYDRIFGQNENQMFAIARDLKNILEWRAQMEFIQSNFLLCIFLKWNTWLAYDIHFLTIIVAFLFFLSHDFACIHEGYFQQSELMDSIISVSLLIAINNIWKCPLGIYCSVSASARDFFFLLNRWSYVMSVPAN